VLPDKQPKEVAMPIDYAQIVKLAGSLSFQTFLIVCVGVLSYALVHLYQDNQAAFPQLAANTNAVVQIGQQVEALTTRINALESGLQVCLRIAPAHGVAASGLPTANALMPPIRLDGRPLSSLEEATATPGP